MIHATAIIDPSAQLAADVEVGAYSVIGADVSIGAGTIVGPHVVIKGPTSIGCHNRIYQFASVGEDPQQQGYNGEPTRLVIGDHNLIREFASINRGSTVGQGVTQIGNRNFFMSYTHVAHDCVIGDDNIFANNAQIAGHVHIAHHVILGAYAGVHQFCHVGAYAFLGRAAKVIKDVLPYVITMGNPAFPHSINIVGLRRNGFKPEQIRALKRALLLITKRGLSTAEVIPQLEVMAQDHPEVQLFIDSLHNQGRHVSRFV